MAYNPEIPDSQVRDKVKEIAETVGQLFGFVLSIPLMWDLLLRGAPKQVFYSKLGFHKPSS
jgi:hypothetical protein